MVRGDHNGGKSRLALPVDEYIAICPPADGRLACWGNGSNWDFNLSTFAKLTSYTLRRFSDTDDRNSIEAGSGVITNRR